MTEYTYSELFTQKLLDMGLTKAQAQSKSIATALAVFANTDEALDAYQELLDLTKKVEEERRILVDERNMYSRARFHMENKENEYKCMVEELEDINEKLSQFETPEARDRYRLAEYYKRNTTRKNVYQETEFNKGLGLILAGMTEKSEDKA